MQSVSTMIRRPVSFGAAATGGFVAFAVGVVIAVGAPAAVAGFSASRHLAPAPLAAGQVGAQQVAHDRSEQGIGQQSSVGGEQIAQNRSEEGLASS